MKHLFMAFIILFASLSSSWAGVAVSDAKAPVSQSHHQMMHHHMTAMDHGAGHQHHAMPQMASHDCCEPAETHSAVQTCMHGFSECQCDMGCSMNASVATLSEHVLQTSLSEQALKTAFTAAISQTFLQTLDRPPQAS